VSENAAPNGQPSEEKLIGYRELGEYLGFCRHTIRAQMRKGKIPYFKFGRSIRFRLSDVKAKIETTRQAAENTRSGRR
jgi:excisionase family DNA binding protein